MTNAGKCIITDPRIAVPVFVGQAVKKPQLGKKAKFN